MRMHDRREEIDDEFGSLAGKGGTLYTTDLGACVCRYAWSFSGRHQLPVRDAMMRVLKNASNSLLPRNYKAPCVC